MDSELLPTCLFPTYLFPLFFPQFTPPHYSASLNCPFLPFISPHLFTLMSMSTNHKQGIRVCIDRGGTFTDCVASIPVPVSQEHPTGRKELVVKLLSVDPSNYPDAPREGIRRILEIATGEPHPRDKPVATHNLGRKTDSFFVCLCEKQSDAMHVLTANSLLHCIRDI